MRGHRQLDNERAARDARRPRCGTGTLRIPLRVAADAPSGVLGGKYLKQRGRGKVSPNSLDSCLAHRVVSASTVADAYAQKRETM